MFGIFTIFLLAVTSCHGQRHGGNGIPSSEVDAAIVNLNLHYSDKLCLELLLVDCTTHVTQGDEKICASNGVTYENHCRFTHAMCEYLHSPNNSIHLVNHGECVAITTAAPSGTNGPIVTNAPGVTNPPMTTLDSIAAILQNVFCQNVNTISCESGVQIICGSDGQFYPNQCELSKTKCNNPSLTIADYSKCAIP